LLHYAERKGLDADNRVAELLTTREPDLLVKDVPKS